MNTQRTIRSAALILFFTVASIGCMPTTAAETKEIQITIPTDIPTRKTFTIAPTFTPTPDPRAGWTSFTSRLNSARDMEFDKDGYLWVVPNGKEGIVRWDVKEKSFVRYTEVNGLPDLTVSSVAAEPDGGVWVGFDNPFGKKIARFKNGEWKNFSGPDNHLGAIHSMVVGPKNVLWMVYGDEVVSFDGNSWKYFDEEISRFPEKPYQGPSFSIIAAAPNGNIWAVTKTKGLLFYDGDTWVSMSGQNGLSDERIKSLSIGPDGMVWVITTRTDKTTLFTYDESVWTKAPEDVFRGCGADLLVATSNKKAWWVSCAGIVRSDGVTSDAFLGNRWSTIPKEHCYDLDFCLPFNYATAFAVDRDGSLWIGTDSQGLFRFDGERIDSYVAGGPIGDNFTDIVATPDGTVWVRSPGEGVSRFDGKQWSAFLPQPGLPLNGVGAMDVSPDGSMWFIGSDNSLLQYKEGTWHTYPGRKDLGGRMKIAPDGAIWFSGYGEVLRWKGNLWQKFPIQIPGFLNSQIFINSFFRSIYAAPDGTVWFGTLNGIIRYQKERWSVFTMPYKSINSLIVTKKGETWYSADDNYASVIGGPSPEPPPYDYIARFAETSDAYRDYMELIGIYTLSIAEAPDGALWVGSSIGLHRFDGAAWKSWSKESGIFCITDVAVAEDGSVWMVDEVKGILRYQMPKNGS